MPATVSCDSVGTMSGKTCLVTGATTGIGKQTAIQLAGLGARLIIVARDPARGEAACDEIRQRVPGAQADQLIADLSGKAQVRALAARVTENYDRLDVLINNAGVISTRRRLTVDGLETTFATNHLGPFLLTNLLRPLLKQGGRVVTVSSGAHKAVRAIPWDDMARGNPDYGLSKLCNILFTVELAKRLEGTGVTANCLHPGFIRTELGREVTGAAGAMLNLILRLRPGPATGAKTSVYLATSKEVEGVTGGYFFKCKPARASALATDAGAAARLWTLSEELTRA